MAGFKQQRINELLLNFLGEKVRLLQDPRLQYLSITSVEVSRDMKYATVHWSAPARKVAEDGIYMSLEEFPDKEQQEEIVQGLQKAKKYLKALIGQELDLRNTPDLVFKYDESLERGSRIDSLLSKIGQQP